MLCTPAICSIIQSVYSRQTPWHLRHKARRVKRRQRHGCERAPPKSVALTGFRLQPLKQPHYEACQKVPDTVLLSGTENDPKGACAGQKSVCIFKGVCTHDSLLPVLLARLSIRSIHGGHSLRRLAKITNIIVTKNRVVLIPW